MLFLSLTYTKVELGDKRLQEIIMRTCYETLLFYFLPDITADLRGKVVLSAYVMHQHPV